MTTAWLVELQGSRPAVFGRDLAANTKSVYAITCAGRLAQLWDTDRWNVDFPAELAGFPDLRFRGGPAVFGRDLAADKKSLYAVTADRRLAQLWDTDRWNLDFPAELAGFPDLRFRGSPAVLGRDADKKSLYAVTADRRLAQLWDTDRWNLDFPAELAGFPDLRFRGSPAVLGRDADKKSLYAVTADRRLAQLWDTDRWNLDFPAELAGFPDLRFQGSPAVVTRPLIGNIVLAAVSAEGRLVRLIRIATSGGWSLDFPAESAGFPDLRFQGSPAIFGAPLSGLPTFLYAVSIEGRLTQMRAGVTLDFPGELAGFSSLMFRSDPAVFVRAGTFPYPKGLYAIATEGRLAQLWDTDRWNLDFPADLAAGG